MSEARLANHVIAQAILDYTNPGDTASARAHKASAEAFLFQSKGDWADVRRMWLASAGLSYLTPAKIRRHIKTWKRSDSFRSLDELVKKLKSGSAVKKSRSPSLQPSPSP